MKLTGLVRKADEPERVVIPIKLHRKIGIEIKFPLEIYVYSEQIVLMKYALLAFFAGMPIISKII